MTAAAVAARWRRAILALCWIVGPAFADTLHIIELRHRPAAEILPLIQPLLRVNEAVNGAGYQLFLRATEAREREIEQLVAKLDVAPRQFTITVQTGVRRSEYRARDGVSGQLGAGGPVRAVIPDEKGGTEAGLRYRGERRTSIVDATSTQVVRVQEGRRASIRIGRSIPSADRVLVPDGRSAVLARGDGSEDFTTGFDVVARARGDGVELEITPRLVDLPANGVHHLQELRTTVSAQLGEWIDVGRVLGETADVDRAILEGARTQGGQRSTVVLKVE